jgi:hypothetical protein
MGRRKMLRLVVAATLSLLVVIIILEFLKTRDASRLNACITNMQMIDSTKEASALLYAPRRCKPILEQDLSEYLKNESSKLVCPEGGRYTINSPGDEPQCSVHGSMTAATQRK